MIHYMVMAAVRDQLTTVLITNALDDEYRPGAIKIGDLQGEPDPDVARISVTIYTNDPDSFISGAVTAMSGSWNDELDEDGIEIGGAETWRRRFTIKIRCLLEQTGEDLEAAHRVASTIKARVENNLRKVDFSGIEFEYEYVSRYALSIRDSGESLQSGGPPDSYDFLEKIRFEVLTTKSGGL